MSGDRPTSRQDTRSLPVALGCLGSNLPVYYSFGDPNAHPPTPKDTPTSSVFPSPVFERPKNHQGSFDESASGWTTRFTEEYPVFNSPPGNPGALQGQFLDFSASTAFLSSPGHKRPLSTENVAAQIASHVNHLSPNPNLPLPPVDPSRRLLSSPGPLATGSCLIEGHQHSFQQGPAKKTCREAAQDVPTQTATPPPSGSGRSRERKIAPKLPTETMQDDQVFGQEFVVDAAQQQNMANFVATSADMFAYPIPGPATASAFTDSRSFWDTDVGGMDIDFSPAGADVFQVSNHRPMNSLDWEKQNQMFQETAAVPRQHQENQTQPTRKERALAPKPSVNIDTSTPDMTMFSASFPTPVEDAFAMMNQGNGVDPGLLFTRPPSSSMDAAMFDPMAQPALMQSFSQADLARSPMKQPMKGELRRSASAKDTTTSRKVDRASASSPVKSLGRPGLSRSSSENRGKKPPGRASTLPTLAPAIRPAPQQNPPRPTAQTARSNGRTSPIKNHHHRPSTLSSIPEATGSRLRTSVKFTIDSRGRARAETTTVIEEGEEGDAVRTIIRNRKKSRSRSRSKHWDASEDDESSTDDEPIIIPSRNTSFALPDARKPTLAESFHSSHRGISEQDPSSLGICYNELDSAHNDAESEAETVMNWPQTGRGDAASELRKVVENKKMSLNTSQRFVSGPPYSSARTSSPTTSTDASLPTPSAVGGSLIRCVCDTTTSRINRDGYLVQW
ncbi:hypothetical protein DL766_007199 [Monosporascus sp. MC13-8B]|nr:hypothetical protein DL763_005581 [Monosporascus cannonballus]RYP24861.1 hypothetical protein DL766_007199 [Monosporascus sp. MC13-8B]